MTSILASSDACLGCLPLLPALSFTFIPRRQGYIPAYVSIEDIAVRVGSASVLLRDISLLTPFHSTIQIASLIRHLTQAVVVCTDHELFLSLSVLFTQTVEESALCFTVLSPKTKKAHTILKQAAVKEKINVDRNDDSAERDVMSVKQQESKDGVELPFEKVGRFGDDSDVSSDDDDLDV